MEIDPKYIQGAVGGIVCGLVGVAIWTIEALSLSVRIALVIVVAILISVGFGLLRSQF